MDRTFRQYHRALPALALLVVLLASESSSQEWLRVSSPTSRTLRAAYFIDSLRGWVAGDSGTIFRTANGGTSWVEQNSTISTGITDIFMVNERLGWALSVSGWGIPGTWRGTFLLKTTNGGDEWAAEQFPDCFFWAVYFVDSLHGYMGGQYGLLVGTEDGGFNWFTAIVETTLASQQPVRRIMFLSPEVGYAVGGSIDITGTVWKTTDAGHHWVATGMGEPLLDLSIRDSLNIVCIGGGFDDGVGVARSRDGGNQWEYRFLSVWRTQATSMSFRTYAEGWATLGSAGAYISTSDTGDTWVRRSPKSGPPFYDVMFTDPRHGYMVGASGTVMRYNAPTLFGVKDRWNLVALPVLVGDHLKSTLFPTATSSAFSFTPSGYQATDTILNGHGYWMKFNGDQLIGIQGVPYGRDTLPVIPGWNIIGCLTDPVPTGAIIPLGTTVQTQFFSYDHGYIQADTIKPGKGYWVKVDSPGSLVMASGALAQEGLRSHSPRALPDEVNTISFKDASGNKGILMFTVGSRESSGDFELPPPGPDGVYDVRFSSGLMLEPFTEEWRGDGRIVIRSAVFPLTVSWQIRGPDADWELISPHVRFPLGSGGSVVLRKPPRDGAGPFEIRLSRGGISPEALPSRFSLSQNNPNPFNPVTAITFELPHPAAVTIVIYDVLGREITMLQDGREFKAGRYVERWDASSSPSGVYYYRLTAFPADRSGPPFTAVRKMLLLR